MATAESVKSKLQGLISKANAKTGKNDADLTDAVNTLVSGYGQGGGGGDIIEVDTLPETNIGENAVYLVRGYYGIECYYRYGNRVFDYNTAKTIVLRKNPNAELTICVVDDEPSNPTTSDLVTFGEINIYIINNIPKVYGNVGSGNMWIGIAEILSQDLGYAITVRGFTNDIMAETAEGIYVTYLRNAIATKNWGYHLQNNKWVKDSRYREILTRQATEIFESDLDGMIAVPTGFMADISISESSGGYSNGTTELEKVTLPNTIITILDKAFYNCRNLTNINLPNSLKQIGERAFENCALKSIDIPNSVTIISEGAFLGCAFESVVLNVDILGNYAFSYCQNLKTVIFKKKPTSLGWAFSDDENITDVYVPWAEGEVADAPWGALNATIHYNSDTANM